MPIYILHQPSWEYDDTLAPVRPYAKQPTREDDNAEQIEEEEQIGREQSHRGCADTRKQDCKYVCLANLIAKEHELIRQRFLHHTTCQHKHGSRFTVYSHLF